MIGYVPHRKGASDIVAIEQYLAEYAPVGVAVRGDQSPRHVGRAVVHSAAHAAQELCKIGARTRRVEGDVVEEIDHAPRMRAGPAHLDVLVGVNRKLVDEPHERDAEASVVVHV